MKKLIPDCFWPVINNGEYVSHEAVCLLNTDTEAVVANFTFYFEDREKMGPVAITIGGERTNHVRLDKLTAADGTPLIPRGVPYAIMIECDKEIPVQYTRVDTTQPSLTITTTMI